jgi:hypothetical protein
MAQNLVVTAKHNPFMDGRMPLILILDWTSAANGTVSLGVAATYAAAQLAASGNNPSVVQPVKVRGELALIETIPGLHGDRATNLPTSYALTILDDYGRDITGGVFGAASASIAEAQIPQRVIQIDSELTVTITGAGSGTNGRTILHFKESENRP